MEPEPLCIEVIPLGPCDGPLDFRRCYDEYLRTACEMFGLPAHLMPSDPCAATSLVPRLLAQEADVPLVVEAKS